MARRSDPLGMEVQFEINSPSRVSHVVIDTVGDGEPGWTFNADAVTDYRAFRGMRVKPVVNGTWEVVVRGIDERGCVGNSHGSHPVTVVF